MRLLLIRHAQALSVVQADDEQILPDQINFKIIFGARLAERRWGFPPTTSCAQAEKLPPLEPLDRQRRTHRVAQT